MATDGPVTLIIRDMTGRVVMEKTEGFQPAGKHNLTIDVSGMDSGIYFYTLSAGLFNETKRMTISK
jgi:hypothetical protein